MNSTRMRTFLFSCYRAHAQNAARRKFRKMGRIWADFHGFQCGFLSPIDKPELDTRPTHTHETVIHARQLDRGTYENDTRHTLASITPPSASNAAACSPSRRRHPMTTCASAARERTQAHSALHHVKDRHGLQGWVAHRVAFWPGYASTVRVRCTALALYIDMKDPERSARAVRPVPSHCKAHRKACQTSLARR